jgi:hypothetical protein
MVILIPSNLTLSDVARSAQQNENDGVASEKHLADETVLVDLASFLPICQSWGFCPHLLCVLKNHVAVTIECLDAGEQFAVVAARDQDLCARPDGGLEDRKRSCGELMLFDLCNFVLAGKVSIYKELAETTSCHICPRGLPTLTQREASRSAPCMLLAECNFNRGVAGPYCNLASTILKAKLTSWVELYMRISNSVEKCKCR